MFVLLCGRFESDGMPHTGYLTHGGRVIMPMAPWHDGAVRKFNTREEALAEAATIKTQGFAFAEVYPISSV